MAGVPALLSIERHGAVALVTLQRPERRNALSIALRGELADACAGLAADTGVSCIVLTGAGDAFCSGMDTTEFGGDRTHRLELVESSVRAFEAVARSPLPIVAAVNGAAVAGGFALALLCDLRVASTAATFGFPELGRGIPPSYAAARAVLAPALARRLCLGRETLDAARALALGVVSEVCEPAALRDRALEVAAGIAAVPRWTVLEVKRRILLDAELSWGRLLDDEARALRAALLDPDPDAEPEPAA